MFLQNNGNRIKCYQNAIKATYDARKSQCLCGFPGSLLLFILSNRIIHPDFTVLNVRTREILYWEHLGMMDNKEYIESALAKIAYI